MCHVFFRDLRWPIYIVLFTINLLILMSFRNINRLLRHFEEIIISWMSTSYTDMRMMFLILCLQKNKSASKYYIFLDITLSLDWLDNVLRTIGNISAIYRCNNDMRCFFETEYIFMDWVGYFIITFVKKNIPHTCLRYGDDGFKQNFVQWWNKGVFVNKCNI